MRDMSADKDVSSSCTSTLRRWRTATWKHFFCDMEHVRLSCWCAWRFTRTSFTESGCSLCFPSILSHPPPEAQRTMAIFSLVSDLRREGQKTKKTRGWHYPCGRQRLAAGRADSAAYSVGPHLSCAKFKACLGRGRPADWLACR